MRGQHQEYELTYSTTFTVYMYNDNNEHHSFSLYNITHLFAEFAIRENLINSGW